MASGRRTLQAPILRGSALTFELRVSGCTVDVPIGTLLWRGASEGVGFGVDVPFHLAEGTTLIGRLAVRCNGIPVGDIAFKLGVGRASAALGMRFFQDVLSIDPGQRWERRLYEELDTCDALLLFWSQAATRSDGVRKEVGYALRRNGGDEDAARSIRPVFVEGLPVEPPWDELSRMQWDDPLLYFRR